jgi:hypothetical protein
MLSMEKIADIVVEEMDLENVEYKFKGGVDGGRGWSWFREDCYCCC